MKKILLIMVATFMSVSYVNADTINSSYSDSQEWLFSNCGSGSTACTTFLKPEYIKQKYDLNHMYQQIMNKYNEEFKENYPYYIVNFINESKPNGDLYYNRMYLSMYENLEDVGGNNSYNQIHSIYENETYTLSTTINNGISATIFNSPFITPINNNSITIYSPLVIYDSNVDIKNNTDNTYIVENISLTINPGEIFTPYLKTEEKNYTIVDLDNYEYVILNLKDYSKTESFGVDLKVKGMIGITPVYEFGTIEKETITDRCNISYSDYTDYRLYVLKNDLINNVVYYVKDCEDGSSIRIDNTIFDITYVTADNVDDPVITVGGKEYHTIPFKKLSNSANQNEENNFIPGASEEFDPLGSLVSSVSNFWESLTTLMGLVTKFFNTLPIEIRAISITMFTTAITLGVIKFIKS